MSHKFENKLGHIGAVLDDARSEGKTRIDDLVDRVEHSIESLRGDLDDLKVQAALGKLEVREATQPVIETLRNRSLDAGSALGELREELHQARTGVALGATAAIEDIEAGVGVAKEAFK